MDFEKLTQYDKEWESWIDKVKEQITVQHLAPENLVEFIVQEELDLFIDYYQTKYSPQKTAREFIYYAGDEQ